MNPIMEGERFSLMQLKEALRQLGLPRGGNKAELTKRLWEYDPSGSWKDLARRTCREEEPEGQLQAEETIDNEDRQGGEDRSLHPRDNAAYANEVGTAVNLHDRKIELVRRELDLLRRERDLDER